MDETAISQNDSFLFKLQSLPWKILRKLFVLILKRIFNNETIDHNDVRYTISFFGTIFCNKYVYVYKIFRHEALKLTKAFILERFLRVSRRCGRSGHDDELTRRMIDSLRSIRVREPKRHSLNWLDSTIGCGALFSESLEYMLTRFGAFIQSKWLLDRFARHIAVIYFKTARSNGEFNLANFDPMIEPHFRLITTLVLSTDSNLGKVLIFFINYNYIY